MTPVLDASVFISAISPAEHHHRHARALFDRHAESLPFLVPSMFRVEVLDTVDALARGPRFHVCPPDEDLLGEAVRVARVARIRAYDAVYVALALARDVPLLSLDADVLLRCQASLPGLRLPTAL